MGAKLEKALRNIEKLYGDGTVSYFNGTSSWNGGVIPTGSIGLDVATGIGGFPYGRIVELFGLESSGKTTLALHIIASAQRKGGQCAFIDVEHALDPTYASSIGVDMDTLLISQPDYGEQALNIAEQLVDSEEISCVVVDSVAALITKAELDGDIGDVNIGGQARLMSQAMRKLTAKTHKNNTLLVFINQMREKVNTFGYGGNPYDTPGGKALKFYSSMRVEIKFIGQNKQGDVVIGNKTVAKIVKNKMAPPFKSAQFLVRYGIGIDYISELMEYAKEFGLIKQSGSWFSIKSKGEDIKIGQGAEAAREWLVDHPGVVEKLRDKIVPHNG